VFKGGIDHCACIGILKFLSGVWIDKYIEKEYVVITCLWYASVGSLVHLEEVNAAGVHDWLVGTLNR
jgi:hypothetical protein